MQENPFAPHAPAPPQAFVDRQREVDLIFGHIQAIQRGNVALNGPLGIGKTSLLRFVADPARAAEYGATAPEYALVYIDIQSVTPFSATRFWRRAARLLARNTSHPLAELADDLLRRETIDIIDLEEFLDGVADAGSALVLLLDEFEWALQANTPEAEAESRNFLAQMASLARRTPRALAIVVATEAPLAEATQVIQSWRGSPFSTLFTSVTLKPLSREDADLLIDHALAGSNVDFGEDDRNLLYSFSGGQPAALQAAAFSLFHGRQQEVDRDRLWDNARQAAEEALDALERNADDGEIDEGEGVNGEPPSTGLWLDTKTGEVLINGERVESLTALEYSLLSLLYGNAGRLCSKDEIIRSVWGEEFSDEVDDSRVEKLVSRLRRKIEPMPSRPQFVRTVRGRGYRFVP